jgi:predicted amidohydrolase YtcJ
VPVFGGTQSFGAKQMTIVPGFIDAHNHAPGAILLYEVLVGNPYQVEFVTIASIVDKLRAKASETPPGFWVEGYFFDDTKVKDNRQLNIHDLDQVSGDHPVEVRHRGGHTTFYNSKAFELASVTRNTPDSEAGTYDRDDYGQLNGRVTDRARSVFDKVGKRPTYTAEQAGVRNRDALSFISKQFVRYGLTGVHQRGRRPLRAATSSRARRPAASSELRGPGRLPGGHDQGRHRHRFRRRVDQARRHLRTHLRWLILGAHHGAQRAVSRRQAALSRQRHDDARGPQRLGRAHAPRRHPIRSSMQRVNPGIGLESAPATRAGWGIPAIDFWNPPR